MNSKNIDAVSYSFFCGTLTVFVHRKGKEYSIASLEVTDRDFDEDEERDYLTNLANDVATELGYTIREDKLNKYGYFYILSTCECHNERLQTLDGTEFQYLSEAVDFLIKNKEEIMAEGEDVCIMVWKEIFDENGNHYDNECVDDIYLSDII